VKILLCLFQFFNTYINNIDTQNNFKYLTFGLTALLLIISNKKLGRKGINPLIKQ